MMTNEMMMNLVNTMMQSQMQSQQMMMSMMMSMMQTSMPVSTPAPAVQTAPTTPDQISGAWQATADPQTIKAVDKPNEKPASRKDDAKFPPLGEPTVIGDNVTVYDGQKVRYWELGFLPSKVKYGIKCSLKDAGASWDKESGAFVFKTKKDCTAWCKAQKERTAKKSA